MSRRILAAGVLFFFLGGDVAAASRGWDVGPLPPSVSERLDPRAPGPVRLAQNPCAERQQPANPCGGRPKRQSPPSIPPSVGRDKVDQRLRELQRRDDEQGAGPRIEQTPQDDDAIRRLGERLRRQPIPPPAAGVIPPLGDPG